MLFLAAATTAEMERDLMRERTLDGLRAAQAANEDLLAVAHAPASGASP